MARLWKAALMNVGRFFLLPGTTDPLLERRAETREVVDSANGADFEESVHPFSGRHLLVSYRGCCNKALRDRPGVLAALKKATRISGATILSCAHHYFPNDGLTAVLLLAESHASIHTYPEHGACFVDLFTCGQDCRAEIFEGALRNYLHPAESDRRVVLRSERSSEDCFRAA